MDDPLGTKAVGKAIESSVEGIGRFLGKLCMPAAEEFGLLLRDKVALYRIHNLDRIVAKAQAKIEHHSLTVSGEANPRLVKEIVEESSWASDDCLQEMWAGLIAESAAHGRANDDSLIYVETLKHLTGFQARFLNRVYSDPRCCSIRQPRLDADSNFVPENPILFDIPKVLRCYPGPLNEIVPIRNVTHNEVLEDPNSHGIAIGRFRPQIDALATRGLLGHVDYTFNTPQQLEIIPSVQGLDFYMRCLGYAVYPLDAADIA